MLARIATPPRANGSSPSGRARCGGAGLAGLAALAAAVALAAGGCGRAPEKPLVVAFGEAPVSLDPHASNRNVGWSVLATFLDPLVSLGPDLRPRPALAQSWEHPTPTRWLFHLRRGVTFCTGEPLTAADVVASFERARTLPRSAVVQYLVGVRSVTAADPGTVVIETDGYQADLLNRLAFILVVRARDAGPGAITRPVGTGPYRFAGERSDGAVLGEAWPGWHGRPACAQVVFEFLRTGEAAVGRLLAGQADVCHLVPDRWLAEVARSPITRLEQQPRLVVQLVGISPTAAVGAARRALADVRVRRALLLALDRASWVTALFRGNAAVASQYVHPAVFGYDPSLVPAPYDPAEARRLLAEAGYAHGFDVELAYDPAAIAVANAIVSDLAKVGVRVRLRPGAHVAALRFFGWACATGDASDFFESLVRTGGPRQFGDPAIDALLDAAGRESDPVKRLVLLQQAQRRTLDLLPLLPLTIRWGFKGVAPRVDVVVRYDEREDVAAFHWSK